MTILVNWILEYGILVGVRNKSEKQTERLGFFMLGPLM